MAHRMKMETHDIPEWAIYYLAYGECDGLTEDEVDMLVHCEQQEKQRLVQVSSNFANYSEDKIRESYEAVKDVQVRLALAKEMGAAYAINTKTEDVHARLQEITGGFGPDVIIEAVGSAPTYQMAVNEVAFTGRVVCIGYAKTDVSFQTKFFVQKELDIRGSRNAQPADFRAVIHYLQRGTCPVDRLISNEVTPEDAPEAMRQWSENPGKVFRILVHF